MINSSVMWRKLLIIHLLLVLVLQPAAQAISPTVSPVETDQTSHELTIMENSPVDPNHQKVNVTGRDRVATAVTGNVPAPVLCWKQGERMTLDVTNNMAVDISIHWHG